MKNNKKRLLHSYIFFTDHDHAGFQDYSPKSYSFDRNSIYEKHHPLPSNNYSERYVVMV